MLPLCQTGVLAIKIFMLPLVGYDAESWLIEQFTWKGPLEAILSKPVLSRPALELYWSISASCWPQIFLLNTELLTSHLQIQWKSFCSLETANYHSLNSISLSHTVLF